MLQDWAVGVRRNCNLLRNTPARFSVRVNRIEFSDAISGLFAAAPVRRLFAAWTLWLDSRR
jgi:hypothetical protein